MSAALQKKILIVNDDGITADGLLFLARELQRRNYDLRVFAPTVQQSGKSHSITIWKSVYAVQHTLPGELAGIEAYEILGTPADCLKVSLTALAKDWIPDLVVSGINDGLNIGLSNLYSGTVGAATEAALAGIPAIAFSIDHPPWTKDNTQRTQIHWETGSKLGADLIDQFFSSISLPRGYILNVNFPDLPLSEIKGLRWTKQGVSGYDEKFQRVELSAQEQKEDDLSGKKRYKFKLTGSLVEMNEATDGDYRAVLDRWVSVSPMGLLFLAHDFPSVYERLSKLQLSSAALASSQLSATT